MARIHSLILAFILALISLDGFAQQLAQTAGTLVVVPAYGEVKHPNDEARVTFMLEEQDPDKSAAASRLNQKMKQGSELIRREDRQAVLKTRGYYTYPVYQDEPSQARTNAKARRPAAWRVGQYLEMTTTELALLPKTVAAAQRLLAVSGLHFGLTETTNKKLEEQRIAAAYQNLLEKTAAIAKAMGRSTADAVIDTIDFDGTGAYAQQQEAQAPKAMRAAAASDMAQVEEPSFEPGETAAGIRLVAKIRFK